LPPLIVSLELDVLLMPRRNENALQFVEKGMVALGARSARYWLTSRGQWLFVKRRDELRDLEE